MAVTLRSQRVTVRSLLHPLPPQGQLGFGLGVVERLTLLAQRVHPRGLPPTEMPYDDLFDLIDRLWNERLAFEDAEHSACILRSWQDTQERPSPTALTPRASPPPASSPATAASSSATTAAEGGLL